jgi:hypothetical protein
MNEIRGTGFSDRLKTAADARRALLSSFRAKPTVTAPNFQTRAEARVAELARVRQARAVAKAAKRQAATSAAAAARQAAESLAAVALDAKRGQRRERKSLSNAEAKAKRDARYAARKARA